MAIGNVSLMLNKLSINVFSYDFKVSSDYPFCDG